MVTPCAHVMCRECLLSAMHYTRAEAGGARDTGMCPVCRTLVSKEAILTMPSENRFTIDVKAPLAFREHPHLVSRKQSMGGQVEEQRQD